jgi:uncharacterized protein YndB with AHSA1/START domain
MDIRADAVIPFPPEQVFAAYRDRLAELADYLPNIASIEVLSREELPDGTVRLVNEWRGSGADLPKVARAFVAPEKLRWTDHASWHPADLSVDWRSDVHAFPGAVQSSGKNRFVATGQGTRLEIRGRLSVDATKIPGVPRLLAATVSAAVEKVLGGQVAANATKQAEGLTRLLQRG